MFIEKGQVPNNMVGVWGMGRGANMVSIKSIFLFEIKKYSYQDEFICKLS